MQKLRKNNFNKKNINSFGNMFLLGNGHLGYRGTLEEYTKKQYTGLNVMGVYDQYQDKWRESLNVANPFFTLVKSNDIEYNVLSSKPIKHYQELDVYQGQHIRYSEFKDLIIESKRFVSKNHDDLLAMKYEIKAKNKCLVNIKSGLDYDIWEINGPHYLKHQIEEKDGIITCTSKTNEGKFVTVALKVLLEGDYLLNDGKALMEQSIVLDENQKITFHTLAVVQIDNSQETTKIALNKLINYLEIGYEQLENEHINTFKQRWEISDVKISGDNKAQFALRYSIYHLLILENNNYTTSISARGLSGQTYKGAIFWDSEIFMLPFYLRTNPIMAKNLLLYRIKTLNGARAKAKHYGYHGAFYAWESQEDGRDACSLYNVSDPITNEPIRTYFADKQIHISGDIAYALNDYIQKTNDYNILYQGGLEMLIEITSFYLSYAQFYNNQYHLNDVLGPDEYHERVNDNAFTNYLAYKTCDMTINYLDYIIQSNNQYYQDLKEKINFNEEEFIHFKEHLFLPKPNEDGIIEQFAGYFALEDTTIEIVKSRLRHPNEYWGGKGPAGSTRIIKQADVVTLLALFDEDFSLQTKQKNYDYYYKYTEHGSSLSSSMYGLLGCWINRLDNAYQMFMKSATVDLGVSQKMYAGGIYIGGTHPAANGGAYLCAIYGFAGMKQDHDKIIFTPSLPSSIKNMEFKYYHQGKLWKALIKGKEVKIKEFKNESNNF